MCGIVGYVGRSEAAPILLDGLRRLEYRGYDSAGVAIVDGDRVETRKCAGRIAALAKLMAKKPASGSFGISHTRWATHGKVNDENAHPHFDASGKIALVHNGVIENYQALKEQLNRDGDNDFRSQTDTEVLAHLIGSIYQQLDGKDSKARLVNAVRTALKQVIGTYGIAVVHADIPNFITGARRGSPLVLGVGKDENFLASDVSAIVAYTRDVVYLNDFDVVAVERDKFEISSLAGETGDHQVSKVEFTAEDIKKGDYPHYMLKEIFEQPDSVRDAMRGRLSLEDCTAKLGGLNMTPEQLREVGRVVLTGCGTALHAAMVGEYLIEQLASIPTEVEYASEFRHRNTPMTPDTLVFAVSQSGETADTLGALRESRRKGYRTLGICNNVASTIARESDGGVYMHAGPEIGVAATKSFTSQLVILTLVGLLLGRMRNLSTAEGTRIIKELETLPEQIEEVLKLGDQVKAIAKKYVDVSGMLFFGRQFNFPIAVEGALKMKEITYLFAEGHPSAELKHGIIALVRPDLPSIFIAPDDAVFSKNLNNIEQVKARKGPIIAITSGNGAKQLKGLANEIILLPDVPDCLSPVLTVIPLQLLAYHLAVELGRDVDKPRNLAKSVTVE
ncbi:MAG: glutamine--fructose-6-phosphate transaminase (isomerizing) [Verrucomicrobia bacterium]|nr:MAG: glutamine--fructose-6-phosphate transaminase (isomerizing) [Verrucomicrobiota bacterium]PYL57554.1 MAG: glutamine--fructose-6-phosphate transaminase (isomerizing) [Verrucomicrobiota bacterium]